jgi:hypothetical protein
MCARARLSSDVSEIKLVFSIPPEHRAPNFAASWNVAPTDPLPVVRYDAKERRRSLDVMRWGLIPYWAQGHQDRLLDHQRQGRGDRHQAGIPRGLPAAALPRAARQFLRMAEDRDPPRRSASEAGRQAAIRDRAQGRRADGNGRVVGDLALARRRTDPQLHDYDDDSCM